MEYSIIIPAYNEEKLLPATLDCLNSILQELKHEFSGEIIVVDNNSDDSTPEIAKIKNARVVFEPENCIAQARNAGASKAMGDFLIFVDADTIVSAELIRKSLDLMNKKLACGGGTIVNFDVEKLPFALRFFSWLWHFHIKLSPLAAGSYIYCLKEAWEDIGGFDESVYASEEIWFSRKLRKWGKKRNLSFQILNIPVITSARKVKQYSTFHMLGMVLLIMLFPWGVRNKKMCHMWYERK